MIAAPALGEACRLEPAQSRLLRAASLGGEAGREAWRAWRAAADLDRLDAGSDGLLPALHGNLHALGVVDPWLDRLKGIWRHTWSRNQLTLAWATEVAAAVEACGAAAMMLGGPALVTRYPHPGSRRADDVHLLVPPADVSRVVDLLGARGWRPTAPITDDLVRFRHAMALHGEGGRAIELSWHVLPECARAEADADFWRHSVALTIGGHPARTLCAADQLVRVCVSGVRAGGTPACRWAADAVAMLAGRGDDVDWERVIRVADAHRLSVPLWSALAYVEIELGAPVPAAALTALGRMATSRMERWEYAAKARARHGRLLGRLPVLWFHHRRLAGGHRRPSGVLDFVDYLRHVWALDARWRVPMRAAAKGLRRLAAAGRWSA